MTYRLNYHVCPEHGWINDQMAFLISKDTITYFINTTQMNLYGDQCIGVMLEVRI